MAYKQYLGARYVPLIDGDWDENKVYEPLTVVNYLNNSYTSKKTVPAGTLPTDSTYWALTGNYNAGIGSLTTRVDTLEGNIEDLEEAVGGLETSLENLATTVETTTVRNLASRNFIFIADSYGMLGWTEGVINRLGLTAHALNVGGAGFCGAGGSVNWTQALTAYAETLSSDEKAGVTDIIVLGGINDYGFGDAAIDTGAGAFITYAHANFPNAMIGCGALSWAFRDNDISTYITSVIPSYQRNFSKYSYTYYIDKMYIPMHNYGVINTDGIHPTEDGVKDIVNHVCQYLLKGTTAYIRDLQPVLTAETGVTLSGGAINNKLTQDGVRFSMSLLSISFASPVSLTGNEIKIGSLAGGAAMGYYSGYNGTDASIIIPVEIYIADNSTTTIGRLHIKNGEVYVSCLQISGGNYVSASILSINACTAFIDLLDA